MKKKNWVCLKCKNTGLVPAQMFPLTCCGVTYHGPNLGPGTLTKAANLARESAAHVMNRQRVVDDATRAYRLAQCESCDLFDEVNRNCTHPLCGCAIKKSRSIVDALGWASKACPIGRWLYQPITKRNLIYHICPLTENDGWLHNLKQLLARWEVFNGRRVIAINTGEGLAPVSEVLEVRSGRDFDFFTVENDRVLREVVSFRRLLEQVCSLNSDEATFYAHTKGNSTAADMRGEIRWRNAMYRHLLDVSFSKSMKLLRDHVFVGCHKMVWGDRKPPYPSGLDHGRWFLAGTFFWFRNDMVFGNPKWQDIPADRYGAEAWPAGIVDEHAAVSVYQKYPEHQTYTRIDNPYNPSLYDGEGLDDEPECPA